MVVNVLPAAILMRVSDPDSAAALEALISRYDAAWNAHDVDAIVALHAPGMVFENHTAGERVEGEAVGPHIAGIFESWPDLAFRSRRLYAREGLVVSEWTAAATDRAGRRLEWDGVDVFPCHDGLIVRKDVYSSSHDPRVLGAEPTKPG
jgi:ketosteroid isomerase-like protein